MKMYIKSSANKNFTSPISLTSGMQVRDADESQVRTVKSCVKKGVAYEVTFEDGDCFMYDPTDKFEVIESATDTDPFDVFMLMGYRADFGPDTMGMEGDDFWCYGKFFSRDIATAKNELKTLEAKYPWINDPEYDATQVYVSEYNEYFDSNTREEQDEYGNPYEVDNNVFQNLEALVEYLGWNEQPYYYGKDNDGSDELPFTI